MQNYNLKNKTFDFLLVLLTFNFLLLTSVKTVSAQQISLSLTPSLTKIVIKPGKELILKYRLINQGDPTLLDLKVVSIETKDNTGQVLLKNQLEGPIRFDLNDSAMTLESPFLMKSNEQRDVNLKIRIPDGTPSDDYYFSLLAQSQPPPTVEGVASLRAKITLGSNLLITVTKNGEVEVKPKTILFEVIPRFQFAGLNFFDSFDKIPLVFTIENSGRNVILAQGNFVLSGFFQNKTYKIGEENILAESQRNFPLTLTGFHLGKYTLSAKVGFAEGAPTLNASTSFIALPFNIIFFLAVILSAIFFVYIRLKSS